MYFYLKRINLYSCSYNSLYRILFVIELYRMFLNLICLSIYLEIYIFISQIITDFIEMNIF